MSALLVGPMSEMLGFKEAKPSPKTKVVAILRGHEFPVRKIGRLWTLHSSTITLKNTRLADLIEQIEGIGGTVERRAL